MGRLVQPRVKINKYAVAGKFSDSKVGSKYRQKQDSGVIRETRTEDRLHPETEKRLFSKIFAPIFVIPENLSGNSTAERFMSYLQLCVPDKYTEIEKRFSGIKEPYRKNQAMLEFFDRMLKGFLKP